GSPPKAVEAPENSFELELTWAWTSRPITTSQSPVAPLTSLPVVAGVFMAGSRDDELPGGLAPPSSWVEASEPLSLSHAGAAWHVPHVGVEPERRRRHQRASSSVCPRPLTRARCVP